MTNAESAKPIPIQLAKLYDHLSNVTSNHFFVPQIKKKPV